MIIEYHRPTTLDQAMKLIVRTDPRTYPLGGGTVLNRPSPERFAVVDLQALGLNKIHKSGNNPSTGFRQAQPASSGQRLEIGATTTLQALLESPHTSPALQIAIKLETTFNLRQMATVAGTLVACDGRSTFATAMLVLDAKCSVISDQLWLRNRQPLSVIGLGDLLPLRTELLRGKVITKIVIPLNVKLAFETVARTPADKPIVCAAVAQWPSGRTRLALGGWGRSPVLAMDGSESGGVEEAAKNAFHEAGDEWASAEYRSEVAAVLAKRCLEKLES